MGIGVGILLIVIGAILAFAVDANITGLDLDVVGWVFILAGVAGLIFFLYLWSRHRGTRTVLTEQPATATPTNQRRGLPPAAQVASNPGPGAPRSPSTEFAAPVGVPGDVGYPDDAPTPDGAARTRATTIG